MSHLADGAGTRHGHRRGSDVTTTLEAAVQDSRPSRQLGVAGAMAVVAGTMLGVGILLTPPVVAAAAPSPWLFAGLWVLGALTALSGCVAYAELGAMLPEAGGDVVFQDQAFGRSLALASGLTAFALAFAGSVAAISVAIGTYQTQTLLDAAGVGWQLGEGVGPLTGARLVGVAIILALTAVNAAGARPAARVQVAVTLAPVLGLAGLAVFALAAGPVAPPSAPGDVAELPALADAFGAVYFTFAGWPAIVYVAGEVRQPGRTLPLAMLGGTVLVSLLYALLCGAFVAVLGFDGLAAAGEAGSALAGAVLGPQAVTVVAGLVLLALLASVNGTILGGARVAQALAARGLLPAALARVGPRTGVPVTALWIQAAIACLLVLTGTFQTILALSSLAMMLVGSVTVLALYRLRRRQSERRRPYRATGYPLTPLLYLLASLGTLAVSAAGALAPDADRLPLVGVALLLLLAGGHRLVAKRR